MRTLFLTLWAAMLLLVPPESSGQWVQTNGPYGGYVTTLAVSGNHLFAGTGGYTYDGGIYRSTDNGESWTEVTNGLPSKWITRIAINARDGKDTMIFAGAGGVLRSTNWGETWVHVNSGLPDKGWVTSFAFHGDTIYTGIYYAGVYLSTDGGESWTYTGLSSEHVQCLAVSPDGKTLFAGSEGNGVYRSTDDGRNWTKTNPGSTMTVESLWITPNDSGGTHLLASGYQGLFLSSDNGANWAYIADLRFNAFAVSGTNLFASSSGNSTGGSNGVYLSTDKGKHWSSIGLSNKDMRAVAVCSDEANGTNIFAGVAWNGGVYRSTDMGKTWKEVNTGITHTNVLSLAAFRTPDGSMNILAATLNHGVHRSSDNGKQWLPADSGLTDSYGMVMPAVHSFLVNGQNIVAGTNHGVFLSTDYGVSWMSDGLTSSVLSIAFNGTYFFAGTDNDGMYRSSINNQSWSRVNLVLPAYTSVYAIVVDGTSMFAGTSSGIFLSTDNGDSWRPVGLSNKNIRALAVKPEQNGPSRLYAGTASDGGVFLSTDNGSSWTAANEGLPEDNGVISCIINAFAVSGNMVFVGATIPARMDTGRSCRVYLSSNNGRNWIPADSGMARISVLSFVISPDETGNSVLYAGTGSGVWRRSLSEMTTAVENAVELPKRCALEQNWPNPFNPATTIGYTVGGIGDQGSGIRNVKLTVYNVLGQEVAVLVNEKQGPGRYSVQFDGSRLASGVYFYRLQAGSYSETRKLVLMR